MAAFKVPYYATIGINLLLKRADGRIISFAFAVEEINEDGIEVDLGRMIASAARHGLIPLNESEYDAWARELAAQKQRERLVAAMQERAEARAIDPARLDEILAAHKGRPGGDA